ncbi:MAG: hypothetical protein Q8K86_08830 [Candidatus Nanopelagicaceae bacterium]|nr:hypothetical protein [Candidatus Nanopelagicaceae bacterium]
MICQRCGIETLRRTICRSCSLHQQWKNGKRKKTTESLQRLYADLKRRKLCSVAMSRYFSDDGRRREHAKRMRTADDPALKSERMKKWWQKNRSAATKFRSLENKTRISIGIKLAGKKWQKTNKVLKKLGIPFERNFTVIFQRFHFCLWPEERTPVLLDVDEDPRTVKAKRELLVGLNLKFRYEALDGATKDLENKLLQLT